MNFKIISAGAGSGKTYRLTQEMVGLLASKTVRASGIIATTFTNKAAAELQERVRVKLLEEGLTKEANDLGNALIGTVHGLGVKLLKRFAFEAGVSPEVDIIAEEDQQLMFNQSLAMVLTNERVVEMESLSERLGLKKSTYNFTDWRKVLKDLTEVARANNFPKDVLDKSEQLSFESFAAFLDEKNSRSNQDWNKQLKVEIEDAISRLENNEDTTKKTADAVKKLKEINNELQLRGDIFWHQWVKLTKVGVGAKSRNDLAPLVDFASKHLSHQGFHQDVKSFISNIFNLSQIAIEEYSRYKKSRGLIDYTDMEVLVNQLIDEEVVRIALADEIDLLMVDEFQDTSPLQLGLFLKLSKLAKHSIWVGDPKQSIYGFRGAEPALMNAIIAQQGGLSKENILAYSWRSREDIVLATNAIFTKAFAEMEPEQIILTPKRCKLASPDSVNQQNEPPEMDKALMHWHFQYDGDGRKPGRSWLDRCLAEQVKTLLERAPVILPKGEKKYRKIRPGDIAILCRSNKNCHTVADALYRAGLHAAIARAGLLNTAEAKLILACLKFILNKYDSLSIAEIMFLASNAELEEIIEDRLAHLNQAENALNKNQWGEHHEMIQQINQLRQQVAELSSAEILTLLLEELNLRQIIVSWGQISQRLANVDQLIKWSFQYEENCNRLHTAASLGGFLLWLNDLGNNEKDLQGAGENPMAVNVLTYHKSKGLEYPVVICHSLDQPLREDVWGLTIVSESHKIDLDNLLGNRWLRYWVNPYADQFRKTKLAERIEESPAKTLKRKEALAEEARLLYVGLTRARDYLIIPTFHQPPTWLNRVFFSGKGDQSLLDPHSDISALEWEGEPLIFNVEVVHFPASIPEGKSTDHATSMLAQTAPIADHAIYFYDESKTNGKVTLKEIGYSKPLEFPEVFERKLVAETMVAFFNAEKSAIGYEQRSALANHAINLRNIEDLVSAQQLLQLYDSFEKWLFSFVKIKNIYRQYPIKIHFSGQLFESTIDLLLESESGWQIIVNSPFMGELKHRQRKAKEMTGKILAMRKSVQAIHQAVKVDTYINFVMAGSIIKIN